MSVFTTKKLKEARNEAHLTQDEVANALKMSVRKIKSIEAGEHPVSVDDILDFISFAGVFVIFLFAICFIAIVAGGLWSTLPLLLGLFAVCVAFFFGTAYLSGGVLLLRNKLLGR